MKYSREKIEKIVVVASLYYNENLTQSEISKRMTISRPLISKMLSEARELGIVKISITSPLEMDEEIIERLKKKFGLLGGVVVHGGGSERANNSFLVNGGAEYIIEEIDSGKSIGIGWGESITSIVKKIETIKPTKVSGSICSLVGNSITPYEEYHTDSLVRKLGETMGMDPLFIYSPTFFESIEELESYSVLENQKRIKAKWESLDLAIINIDSHPSVPDFATASRFGSELYKRKIIGHMIEYYYNIHGEILDSSTDYVNHISKENLKKIKKVIAVCSVEVDIKAIIGALKTGLITHIVIGEEQAKKVLEIEG